MYARIIASLIGYSANEAVEYDFVLFDRGQMAHGVSFMKQNEMSLLTSQYFTSLRKSRIES